MSVSRFWRFCGVFLVSYLGMATAGNLSMSGKQNCVTDAVKGSTSKRDGYL